MYCGSCLQDNALAAELLRRRHEIVLLPLYTPTLTDERNVSQSRVFFGGISVYLQQHVGFFRHAPRFVDRLLDASWILKLAAKRSIAIDAKRLGELTVSVLRGEEGHQRKETEKLVEWLKSEPPFDVIHLPNSLLIGLAEPLKRALGRPVICTLQGEDLFLRGLPDPFGRQAVDLIRAAVPHVDAFIAVSDFYAPFMSDWLQIPRERVHVIPIAINAADFAPAQTRPTVFTIGYLARVAPEKGLHVLCEAFRDLRSRGELPQSRLIAAGWLGPEHRSYLADIQARMRDWGLADAFSTAARCRARRRCASCSN